MGIKRSTSILVFVPWVIVLLSFTPCAVSGQKVKAGPEFDTADFSRKTELAEWLVRYDMVAWKTTDVAMTEDKAEVAKLGAEWFCFQDGSKVWHAVYGKFVNGHYDLVFHYLYDSSGKITKLSSKPDQTFLDAHAQALVTARSILKTKIPEGSPNFNQYIRRNADNTFDVWLFPAFQANGIAVYGGEGIYHIDATGKNILTDSSYFQNSFRGFKTDPPREIWLNYTEVEKPTLGSVFFVWYYRDYFTHIYIDNSKFTSTVVGDSKNGYIWANVEKEKKNQ